MRSRLAAFCLALAAAGCSDDGTSLSMADGGPGAPTGGAGDAAGTGGASRGRTEAGVGGVIDAPSPPPPDAPARIDGPPSPADGPGARDVAPDAPRDICPPCVPPPSPLCRGTGPCGCGPYVCPTPDGGARDAATDAAADICASNGLCAQIERDYAAALQQARACNTTHANQCQFKTNSGLACPLCEIWVNDPAPVEAVRRRYQQAGCNRCLRVCPAVACAPLNAPACTQTVGAPAGTGTCTDRRPLAAP